MKQKSRYVLPEVVDPGVYKCLKIAVPDDQNHIAAITGAIYSLTKPYSWQNDDSHTAIDTASVWLPLFEGMRVSDTCQHDGPGFYAMHSDSNCDSNSKEFLQGWDDGTTVDDISSIYFFSTRRRGVGSDDARAGAEFFDFLDDTPCGGNIVHLFAIVDDPDITILDWSLEYYDCAGDYNLENEPGPYILRHNITVTRFCLLKDIGFSGFFVIRGPVLCGVS